MNAAGDDVTYNAVASGGNGSYSYSWTGATCSGSSCTIDPSNDTFCAGPIDIAVRASDTSGLCGYDDSETESYQKVTTVTITDND